ncbi:MAG: nicotinate phosphoribosyltransferase [Turicibacter sp.]|nr:nicotinate phosphoribosyltransferase [Turicibacter sp.]
MNLKSLNLTMLVDFYELTMAHGYFENDMKDQIAHFDMFFRRVPDEGGFAIMAGLEQLIEYLKHLEFTDEDIEYLRQKQLFSEGFLDYLKNFKFACDIYAIPEGTPIFPNEPILTVRGPIIQAQFIETMILLTINHQSLIATKSNRIVRAANGRPVLELGARRAQGADGAILGARAAYIGGCSGTACTISDRDFNVPAIGTMAHSWVQTFDTEYEAFKKYAELYPQNCTLLVDTYNTLKSGVPNAIRVFKEILIPKGYQPGAIRIDSGDAAYLSKKARKLLDEAGLHEAKIVISNSLDEYIIKDLLIQNAPIDSFGVGERLITSKTEPVFGGVYKIVALEKDGQMIPKIKISNNIEKITNPGSKQVYRLYDRDTNKAIADVITLSHETIDDTKPYTIFDPEHTWRRKEITNFIARPLLTPIFLNGELVYETPTLEKVVTYSKQQIDMLWEEVLRFEKPHTYYVDLSQELWSLKTDLLEKYSK